MTALLPKLGRLIEHETLRPDHGRAWRCMIAFMAPLLLALTHRLPVEVAFVALTAQSIALVDVRGAYGLRFTLLLAMTVILAGAASLGALAAHPLAAALLATALVAAGTGLWRHLSSDYGPSIAVSSSLLFFIALSSHGGSAAALHHLVAALIGGLWGAALQVALWPIRPQHPFRRAVADTWLAAADLFSAMAPADPAGSGARHRRMAESESALRVTLDKTYAVLEAAPAPNLVISRLSELNRAGPRLAMRVAALSTALETLAAHPAFSDLLASFQPALTGLTNTGRTVAVTVVSRQPGHFAAAEVHLRRLGHLLGALQARVAARADGLPAAGQLVAILAQVEEYLPVVRATLSATVDRAAERAAFPLELHDLSNQTLRPLAAALNLSRHVDWALTRFTLRIMVLTLLGVVLLKTLHLPHGYWLPFTMVVVLQPDYGSTRRKAAQRLLGTLIGSIVASLMLWLHLPLPALMAVTAAMSFIFGFFVRRNYGVAVIFITLFVVLLTEADGPVTIALTLERLGTTFAGGLLALLAALMFWPVWEKDRLPAILAKALRANRDYARAMVEHLRSGGNYDAQIIKDKRRAETTNSEVFSSLQRMAGDPKSHRDQLERAAALANGNHRLTRILNLIALRLSPGQPLTQPELAQFSDHVAQALEQLAAAIENPAAERSGLERQRAALDRQRLPGPEVPATEPASSWIFDQLARADTELSAMLLAATEA